MPLGLKDLLKGRFASHLPGISVGSLWSKALKRPYRGTMAGLPATPRIAVIMGKQNKDDGVLCGYLVSITQNLLQSGSKHMPLPGRDTQY